MKVLFLVSRDLGAGIQNGRTNILNFYLETISKKGSVDVVSVSSIFEKFKFYRFLRMFSVFVKYLLILKPVPLQVLLYIDKSEGRNICKLIDNNGYDIVYIDGVRLVSYALQIKMSGLRAELICDFDDLMSRRYKEHLKFSTSLVTGYLTKFIPPTIRKIVALRWFSYGIKLYEQYALAQHEIICSRIVDKIIFVSSLERDLFSVKSIGAKVVCVPPSSKRYRDFSKVDASFQFVFVGSDRFLQNRATIDYICDLWSSLNSDIPIFIYGDLINKYPKVKNVNFMGVAPNISDVYLLNRVLFAPSFVAGGVKTKILEASSWGVMTIGNNVSFEGINFGDLDVCLSQKEIERLVLNPAEVVAYINNVGRKFVRNVCMNHDSSVVSEVIDSVFELDNTYSI